MAAEPKTKPTDASVADFLAAVEHPTRRADGEAVCALLAEVTGHAPVLWGPSIVGFGSARGPMGDWPVLAFSPRKAHLVFYGLRGGAPDAEANLARLGKHATKGGCISVTKLADVDAAVLRQMAEAAWAARA